MDHESWASWYWSAPQNTEGAFLKHYVDLEDSFHIGLYSNGNDAWVFCEKGGKYTFFHSSCHLHDNLYNHECVNCDRLEETDPTC